MISVVQGYLTYPIAMIKYGAKYAPNAHDINHININTQHGGYNKNRKYSTFWRELERNKINNFFVKIESCLRV